MRQSPTQHNSRKCLPDWQQSEVPPEVPMTTRLPAPCPSPARPPKTPQAATLGPSRSTPAARPPAAPPKAEPCIQMLSITLPCKCTACTPRHARAHPARSPLALAPHGLVGKGTAGTANFQFFLRRDFPWWGVGRWGSSYRSNSKYIFFKN